MTDPRPRRNPFFPIATFLGALFIITILACIVTILGDPASPMTKLLDRHGGMLLTVEVISIVLAGVCAMALDRVQTLRYGPSPPLPRGRPIFDPDSDEEDSPKDEEA